MLTSYIITKAQKLNAGDYLNVSFGSKHTEHSYLCILKWFCSHSFIERCTIHTQVVICCVTNQFKNVKMEDEQHKFSLYEYCRVAPILLS